MITVKICSCGKQYRAEAWACLLLKGYQQDTPEDLALRLCSRCGSSRALHRSEDEACKAIATTSAAIRIATSTTRLGCALIRLERANASFENRPVNEDKVLSEFRAVKEQREIARVLRRTLHRLEQMVRAMWRARELVDPSLRIGRTLVVIDGRPLADTEPPIAGTP